MPWLIRICAHGDGRAVEVGDRGVDVRGAQRAAGPMKWLRVASSGEPRLTYAVADDVRVVRDARRVLDHADRRRPRGDGTLGQPFAADHLRRVGRTPRSRRPRPPPCRSSSSPVRRAPQREAPTPRHEERLGPLDRPRSRAPRRRPGARRCSTRGSPTTPANSSTPSSSSDRVRLLPADVFARELDEVEVARVPTRALRVAPASALHARSPPLMPADVSLGPVTGRPDWGHTTRLRRRRTVEVAIVGHRRDRVHEGVGAHRARDRGRGRRAGDRRRGLEPEDIDGLTYYGGVRRLRRRRVPRALRHRATSCGRRRGAAG